MMGWTLTRKSSALESEYSHSHAHVGLSTACALYLAPTDLRRDRGVAFFARQPDLQLVHLQTPVLPLRTRAQTTNICLHMQSRQGCACVPHCCAYVV
jgi:hypothetical protein